MHATAKLFKLGKAQAVRIPARFRLDAEAVEITERDGALILRPKPRDAAEFFARIRAKHGTAIWKDFELPSREGGNRPVPPLD